MKKVTYRNAENNKTDEEILFNLSVELEKYNQGISTRPHEHFAGEWEKYFMAETRISLRDPNSTFVIAEIAGKPVGFVLVRKCETCYTFIIEELFVKKSVRGLGIGKELLNKALELGKKYELPIKVEIFDWNTSAKGFYEKNGFELDGYILKPKE